MGRMIPMVEITQIHDQPTISITLTFIWIAALVSTISGLCGLWQTKSSDDEDVTKEGDQLDDKNLQQSSEPQPQTNATEKSVLDNDDDQFSRPLPPPPSALRLEAGDLPLGKLKPKIDKTSSLQNYMSKTSSARKLTASISMRMSTKLKDKASEFKGKASELKDKATDLTDLRKKHENESLWTKRIILGEKCRLPNQDDEATSSSSYDDEHGNKVITCPPTRQTPMSRSCSFIDHHAISSSSTTIQDTKVEDQEGKGMRTLKHDNDDDDT